MWKGWISDEEQISWSLIDLLCVFTSFRDLPAYVVYFMWQKFRNSLFNEATEKREQPLGIKTRRRGVCIYGENKPCYKHVLIRIYTRTNIHVYILANQNAD